MMNAVISTAKATRILPHAVGRTVALDARSFSTGPSKWAEATPEDQILHNAAAVFQAGLRHHHTANTAYPIAHSKTLSPYRMKRTPDQRFVKDTLREAYGGLDEMMLYVHVPFCQQRCQFCEYTVVDPALGKSDHVQDSYFDALLKEFDLYKSLLGTEKKKLVGFDIGGGTPSMASSDNIARIMDKAAECFEMDLNTMNISIETTPKIAASDPAKLKHYYDMGIRRISMGVQTTDFALAERLGRHDADYLTQARDNIREAGFESFNVDLMYGFPLRAGKEDKWSDTVSNTIQIIDPDHITLYRMRYKGTKMSHLQERVGLQQVNEQSDAAAQVLDAYGFEGWTGKNTYSRLPGDSGCSDYLAKRVEAGIPYIGLGLGAQSFSHNTLSYNLGGVTKRMEQYMKSVDLGRIPVQDLYHLSIEGAMGKFCSVSFYFGGISLPHFLGIFGQTLEEAFPTQVAFAIDEGLMECIHDRLQMTGKGKLHYGGVLALFYAPHIQGHLLGLPGGESNSTAYMSGSNAVPISPTPYVGNPKGRYDKPKRKVKRRDPRPTLDGDWKDAGIAA